MDLRHLRYFVVVAEELNFCRAAERLRIAQPPLSVQIRHLEEELGVQLFYRVKRRITLSPTGEVLFSQARRLLREAEQIADQVREAASGKTGSLSIGFVGTAMYDILPGALRIFRSAFPKIQLNLEDIHSGHQIQALQRRKIDVGFTSPPVQDVFLETEEVVRERLMVALPERHRFRERTEIALLRTRGIDPQRSGRFISNRSRARHVSPKACAKEDQLRHQICHLLFAICHRCVAARYHPRIHAKMSGATIVASDSITYFGVSRESLPQVIFSFGTAPE
jgi:DNA-binding transcriptional LysR family regulator